MDVYVRVSRVGDREGEAYRSPQIQLAHVENWAKLNEVEIGRVVTDEGVPAPSPSRSAAWRAAARVKLVDAHVAELMAGAWDEVTARSADSPQRFVEARERVAKLEAEYDTLSNDPELVLGLGAESSRICCSGRTRRCWRRGKDLDGPGVGDVTVVYVDGQPWLYEQFGDDPARDKQHMRQHIATITLATADPARRRWQPIAERVDVRWHGQDA